MDERRDVVCDLLERLESSAASMFHMKGLRERSEHVDHVLQMGRSVRSSQAKMKKYSNRRSKERPSVNPEDKCAGFFYLEPQSLEVMKKLVITYYT